MMNRILSQRSDVIKFILLFTTRFESKCSNRFHNSLVELQSIKKWYLNEPVRFLGSTALSPLHFFLKENLGINMDIFSESVKKLENDLLSLSVDDIQERIYQLNQFNIRHHDVKHILLKSPEIFLMEPEELLKKIAGLRAETGFTLSDLPYLFKRAPVVFTDPLEETVEKHTYLYFKMGFTNHKELAKSGVMNFTMEHILQRHLFLFRRGQYFLKDRHGLTKNANPMLHSVFCSEEEDFCKIAQCSINEYTLFKDIIIKENNMLLELSTMSDDNIIETNLKDSFANSLLNHLDSQSR